MSDDSNPEPKKRKKAKKGIIRRIFAASPSDAFHNSGGLFSKTHGRMKHHPGEASTDHNAASLVMAEYPDDAQRFDVVMHQVYGLDQPALLKIQKKTFLSSLGSVIGLAVFIWFGGLSLSSGNYGVTGLGGAIIPLPLLAVIYIRNAFLNWQIRERRLAGFSEWAAKPREWIPDLPA